MDRRRQARTKVDVNALLIGEKTVPKGCRVVNVSQNGMQLQCDDDGRLLTFKEGDSVEVYLSIQHEGRLKKLTIPSWVRHVATNSVDVEFHKPDSALVDLIESYRSSEQHKVEASLGRTDRRVAGNRPPPPVITGQTSTRIAVQEHKPPVRPFYSVLLATVFIACVITGGYVYTASIDSRISTLENLSKRQATEMSEIQSRIFSASLQEGRYNSLNARMTAIADAILGIEEKLELGSTSNFTTTLHDRMRSGDNPFADQSLAANVAPPDNGKVTTRREAEIPSQRAVQEQIGAAAASSGGSASTVQDTAKPALGKAAPPARQPAPVSRTRAPVQAEAAKVAAPVTQPAATAAAETAGDSDRTAATPVETPAATPAGPWVINLISSTDKAYVERFSRTSNTDRFNAVMSSATVRGRLYWRLQITGFESATAARARADDVKQALGMKEVWIFKQK